MYAMIAVNGEKSFCLFASGVCIGDLLLFAASQYPQNLIVSIILRSSKKQQIPKP